MPWKEINIGFSAKHALEQAKPSPLQMKGFQEEFLKFLQRIVEKVFEQGSQYQGCLKFTDFSLAFN